MCFFFFNLFIFGCIGSSLLYEGFSLRWPLLLQSMGSRHAGFSSCGARALGTWASVVVAHGLSYSAACGILPDQGSNPCPLHWQADSQPLRHQESPRICFFSFCSLLHRSALSLCPVTPPPFDKLRPVKSSPDPFLWHLVETAVPRSLFNLGHYSEHPSYTRVFTGLQVCIG